METVPISGETDPMVKRPAKAGTAGLKIADYLSQQIDIVVKTGKTQKDIADALGYERPNMISMFKTGATKVPLEKIPALAKSLNVDPGFLFRLALAQYWPDTLDTIAEIFGEITTENERDALEELRAGAGGEIPSLTTEHKKKLRAVFR